MIPTKRVLLIDADTLVYAAASRCETNTDWGDGTWTLTANIDEAKSRFSADVKRIIRMSDGTEFRLALSDYKNTRWREGVLPSYKKNRVQRRPLVYDALREWVANHPKAHTVPTLEGDDLLGIWMTAPWDEAEQRVCVSIDKDMQQIPGYHINYQNARDVEAWRPIEITTYAADRFHMYQTLTGDPIDGYKGCPGVGPKRAESALDAGSNLSEWWEIVRGQYHMKGLRNGEALQQARVARILRYEDYEGGNVKLWKPPS